MRVFHFLFFIAYPPTYCLESQPMQQPLAAREMNDFAMTKRRCAKTFGAHPICVV